MAHARTAILDALQTALTGLSTTGTSVFRNRARPLVGTDLPALGIRALGEECVTYTVPGRQYRSLQVEIACHAMAIADADETCAQVELEVTNAILADRTLGGACAECQYERIEFDYDDEGEQPLAIGRMTWTVHYYPLEGSLG